MTIKHEVRIRFWKPTYL